MTGAFASHPQKAYSENAMHLVELWGGITETRSRTLLLMCVLSFLSLIALSFNAAANPVPPPPPPDTTFKVGSTASGVAWLFLLNIVINMFFLTAFLFLIGKAFGERIGELPRKPLTFLTCILALAMVVTMIGAFVDYYLVMGVDQTHNSQSRVIVVDAAKWVWALVFIFISVAMPSIALLRLAPLSGATLGILVTSINPVWWILSNEFGLNVAFYTIIFALVALPIFMKGLMDFHKEVTSRNQIVKSDAA